MKKDMLCVIAALLLAGPGIPAPTLQKKPQPTIVQVAGPGIPAPILQKKPQPKVSAV